MRRGTPRRGCRSRSRTDPGRRPVRCGHRTHPIGPTEERTVHVRRHEPIPRRARARARLGAQERTVPGDVRRHEPIPRRARARARGRPGSASGRSARPTLQDPRPRPPCPASCSSRCCAATPRGRLRRATGVGGHLARARAAGLRGLDPLIDAFRKPSGHAQGSLEGVLAGPPQLGLFQAVIHHQIRWRGTASRRPARGRRQRPSGSARIPFGGRRGPRRSLTRGR